MLLEYQQRLKRELGIVNDLLCLTSAVRDQKEKTERREKALEFVKRFDMSSKYWVPQDVLEWFQPDRKIISEWE